MNHVYRLVFNAALGAFVVVSEITKGHKKSSRSGKAAAVAAAVLSAGLAQAQLSATALPQGPQLSAGQASVSTAGAVMNIQQSTAKAALNWQSFNIGSQATVNITQPGATSVLLNRVTGADPSQILGSLNANGQVFLVNPQGVMFGQSSRVNVGALVASTLNISDADFMAGQWHFIRGNTAASVLNQGDIQASLGGYVALLAPTVQNEGVISAQRGSIAMAAGEAVTLSLTGAGSLSVQVDPAQVQTQIDNRQLVQAEGGQVVMTARAASSLIGASINNSGVVTASSLNSQGGSVSLTANHVANTGAISADGTQGGRVTIVATQHDAFGVVSATGTQTTGGSVEVEAQRTVMLQSASIRADGATDGGSVRLTQGQTGNGGAYLSGTLSADGASGLGGDVQITGRKLDLFGTRISATGTTGGGQLRVGGDYQGANASVANADTLDVNAVQVDVSATQNGQGGTAVFWSDNTTRFSGNIDARGASAGVKSTDTGGLVEISGAQNLGFAGDVLARRLLLDPANLSIVDPGNGVSFLDYIDPDSTATGFGSTVYELASGKLMVFSPNQSVAGSGAVYVYDRSNHALTTVLRDTGGVSNFTAMGNDTYVIGNAAANSGIGAVGFFDGNGSVSGRMDATNALIGNSYYGQGWGGTIMSLGGGNYAALMANSSTNYAMRGAMKFFNSTNAAAELIGTVGPTTALVGAVQGTYTAPGPGQRSGTMNGLYGDTLGYRYIDNGAGSFDSFVPTIQNVGGNNWIFSSPTAIKNQSNQVLGAMTVVTPATIASGNLKGSDLSLVSFVGTGGSGLGAGLGSGSYLEVGTGTGQWVYNAGNALIPLDATSLASFTPGAVSASNALMLNTADSVSSVTQINGLNFVLAGGTSSLSNGAYARQLNYSGNFSSTFHGTLSAADGTNSIRHGAFQVGVGNQGIVDLHNGNYLIVSGTSQPNYYTFVDGSQGTSGITGLNSTNSLTTALGAGGNNFVTTVLTNGSYVIQLGKSDPSYTQFGTTLPYGALFYGNGTSRQVGDLLTGSVSLLGNSTFANPNLASIKDLGNGSWAAVGGDYITWGGSSVSRLGTLDATKALSGTVGFVNLGNSAFATAVPTALGGAGAIARIDATNASIPTLSSANALVGSSTTDALGSNGVIDVGNGVGAFFSPNWNGGTGAVTTINAANAASRLIGTLSSSNSLVGSSSTDQVGADAATVGGGTTRPMQRIGSTGIYALVTPTWDNNKGAVTLFDTTSASGLTGVLGASNSLVGNTAGDLVGKAYDPGTTGVNANGVLFHDLSGGRFALYSAGWQDASANAVGALTWLTPASGAVGTISNSNSLTGGAGNPIFSSLGSGYYSLLSPGWNSGAGAVTVFQPASAPVGAISSSNSLVNGNASNGNGELTDTTIVSLGGTLRAVLTPGWNASAGAITGFDLTSGITGTIGSSISLTGAAGSELGDSLAVMQSGNLVVASPGWSGGKGAVTWIETTSTGALAALHGTLNIGSSNSLYGSTSGDRVGSGGVTGLSNNVFVVSSPDFRMAPSDTPGAVTLGNGLTNAIRGAVSPVNSYLASAGITTPLPFVIPMGSTGATISTGNQLSDVDIIYPVAMPQGSSTLAYSDYLGQSVTMLPSTITALLNLGTSVTLQATNRLYVGAPIIANNPNGNGGDLTLQTQSGDVMLGADARITTDNGNLLILAGRNFLNYASASPFNTGTGRWRVYANDPATSRVGNLNFDFKEYGKTYGQTLDGETALGSTTNAVVFAQQPSLSVPSGLWDNKDYDGTDALSSYGQSQAAITGLVDGDLLDATVKFATYHADPTYSGTNNIEMTIGSGGVTSSVATGRKPVFGYLNQPTAGTTTVVGQGQINPFNLQLDLSGTVTKVYDGTDAAPAGYTPQFVVPSWATAAPDAGLTFDTSQVSGAFWSESWGWPSSQTGLVTGHSSGNGAQFFMTSGQISLNVPQGARYQATDYSVQINNNYVPGTITARPIVAGLTASNKVYDGTTAATVTGSLSQIAPISSSYNGTGGASPDDVQLSGSATTGAATFSDANAGTGKTVTVNLSGLSLTGADAENYTIGSTTTTANITPKALTITGSTVANKQYDGTAAATVNVGTLSGFVGSETVSATGVGTFASVNVANGINVATTYSLANGTNGGLASNYSLASETLTGNITPAWLAVIVGSLTGSTSKVYDGSTTAVLNAGNFLLTGWVNGDGTDVTVTKTSGLFADKNVGTNKLITVSLASGDFAASGSTLLSNYGLPTTASGNIGEITAKSLTASYSGSNKVYSGNTTATVTGTSSDIVNGDAINFSQTASFVDKNAANGKTINISGISLSGADAGNYSLQNTTATTTANITAKALTASYTGTNKVYDQLTGATVTGSSSDIVNGDAVTFSQTAAFTNKNVGTGKTINISSIVLGGTDAGNYSLQNTTATTTASITAKTLTVAYTGNNRVYDQSTAATVNDTISGIISGDTVSVSETAAFADKSVGTAKTVNITSMALAGADASNYALASTTATTTANITTKALTASFSGTNRVYDATTGATVSGSSSDIISGDTVTVSQTAAAFSNKNVGTGKTISISGISLSGADAANYSLQNTTATTTANITQASLAVSGASAANKVYDGTTAVTVTGGGVTALLSDSVTLSAANATFADKNVAHGKAITTAYTLSGTDAANYTVVQQAGLTADITPKTVSAAYTGVNKVYDAGTTATVTGSLTGGIVGDTITYSQTAAFTDKNVGTGKTVNITGISLGGTDAGNYTLSNTTATTTANITPYALSIGGITANNKVYDGSTLATLSGTASLSGILGSDVVSVGGSASGAFSDKNVGTGKSILVSGLSLSGTDAANYTVGALSATADITAKALTATYTASNKVYDATTAATVSGSSSDVIGNDVVTFSQNAAFANKNVGTGKTVNVTGINLGGTDAGNYSLQNTTATTTADISRASLTVTGASANNKVYDATTAATVSGGTVMALGSDSVTLSGANATFANKNVGTGKTVTAAYTLSGTDAGNYSLVQPSGMLADITPASLSVTGASAANKVYDGSASATVSGGSVTALGSDSVTLTAGSAAFADKNAGSAKSVTSNFALTGNDAANYVLAQPSLSANITPKSVTITGFTASDKTYDATDAVTVTQWGSVSTGVGAETLVLNSGSATFNNANAGNGKTVTAVGYSLADGGNGGLASNYVLSASTATTTANIAKAALTMTAQNATKAFSDTDPTLNAIYSGFVGAETSSVLTGVGVSRVAGEAAGTYIITPTASAANYIITPVSGTFTVAPADQLVIQFGNVNAVYGSTPTFTVTSAKYYSSSGSALRTLSLAQNNGVYTVDDGLGTIASFTITATGPGTSGAGYYRAGNHTITGTGFQLLGGNNFNSSSFSAGNLAISRLAVDLTDSGFSSLADAGSSTVRRTYDGTTNVALQSLANIDNRLTGDAVALDVTNATGAYADSHAGNGKLATFTGVTLSGADAANYSFGGTLLAEGKVDVRELTWTGVAVQNRTYDTTTNATVTGNGVLGNIVAADIGQVSLDASTVGAAFHLKDAGTQRAVAVWGNITGSAASDYSLLGAIAYADIARAQLQVTGASVSNKVYDGTTTATVSGGTVTALAGDVVSLSTAANAHFADKNVGTAKAVTTAYTLSGTDADNYNLVQASGLTANITPKALTAAYTASNKVYDAGTLATVVGSSSDVVGSDVVSFSQSAAFANKNVGTGKTINVSGINLGGTDAGNYSLQNSTATTTANITPFALSIGGVTAANRTYDGTTSAALTGTASLAGVLGNDAVSVSGTASGTFADKNVGLAKTVQVTGLSLSGADAGNYTVGALSATANITAKALTASYSGSNKVYDALTGATVTGSSSDVIGNDVVTFNQTAAFTDKNVGTAKTVNVTGIGLGGTDAGNYSLQNSTATTTADITAKALTATYTASNKVYDATTAATVSGSSSDVIGSDVVTFSQSAAFVNKNVGTGKTVNITGISLSGADAGNYSLQNSSAVAVADITPRLLTLTGLTVNSRPYNGSTTATLLGTPSLQGLLAGDMLSLGGSMSGTFSNPNIGTGTLVSLTGLSLTGPDAQNYALPSLMGTILPPVPSSSNSAGLMLGSAIQSTNPGTNSVGGAQVGAMSGGQSAFNTSRSNSGVTLASGTSTGMGLPSSSINLAGMTGVGGISPAAQAGPGLGGANSPMALPSAMFISAVPGVVSRATAMAPSSGFVEVKSFDAVALPSPGAGVVVYALPHDTFVHVVSETKLSYSARQTDGSPLPEWVRFNTATGEITMNPPADLSLEALSLTVTAVDPTGNAANTNLQFKLKR